MKTVLCQLLLILSVPFFHTKQANAQAPSAARALVDRAIENWNRIYGTTVKAINWNYEGTIGDENKRSAVIAEITDPEKAWMPAGDFNLPAEMTADRVSSDRSISKAALDKWKNDVAGKLKTGQHLMRLNWQKSGTPFSSLCVTGESDIVYDNMLSNAVIPAHHSRCEDSRLGWLWQSEYKDMTRGEITADLVITCNGATPICDHRCNAWMSAGDAKITCDIATNGNCCRLTWAYGWACGFKSVKVTGKGWGIEIEGYIGSSGTGSGSCTECCPIPPVPAQPVIMPDAKTDNDPLKPQTISVKTISGEVVDVFVPSLMLPGDQVTASVVPQTPSNTLNGAVVDVNNNKSNLRDKLVTFIVPVAATIPLILKDAGGQPVARAAIPVTGGTLLPPGININRPPLPPATATGNFVAPPLVQAGSILPLTGSFDGEARNTNVRMGGRTVEVMAESPWQCFIQVPENMPVGGITIQVIENGAAVTTQPVNVIKLELTAPKTNLLRGQKTTINVKVTGLEGINTGTRPAQVIINNFSPNTIQFSNESGNTITRNISNNEIKNGTYNTTAGITATNSGAFSVSADVTAKGAKECREAYKNCLDKAAADRAACIQKCNGAQKWACINDCEQTYRKQVTKCFEEYIKCQ